MEQKPYKTQVLLRIYGVTAGFLSYSAIFSIVMNLFGIINPGSETNLSGLGYTSSSWLMEVINLSALGPGLKIFLNLLATIVIAAIFLVCYIFARRGHFAALLSGFILYIIDFILIAFYNLFGNPSQSVLISLIVIHVLFTVTAIVSLIYFYRIFKQQKEKISDPTVEGPEVIDD